MKISSLLGTAVLLSAASAFSAPVTYTTSGYFGVFPGTTSVTSGTSTLNFVSTTANVDTPVGNNFGIFDLSGGIVGGPLNPFNTSFTLIFNQAPPNTGMAAVAGMVAGSVNFDSGILRYTPSLSSVSIAGFTYTFDNPSYVLQVPAGTFGGLTTIQGTITGSPIPEPSTFALLGAGISALALARRKRAA